MLVRARLPAAAAGLAAAALLTAAAPPRLDPEAARWVETTLRGMTLDQKIGQLVMPSFRSAYLSTDSDAFDRLAALVREQQVGGFLLFGDREPAPDVLLASRRSRATLGRPLDGASILNRLQALSALPLLNAADFETGVGFRLRGGTAFPRAMAFGAAGDEGLAFEAGRITAVEARALGVHVNFAPVADVNNNPRNPVINTRSFGEDPALVARLAAAWVRGLQAGGMVATLKHFPGHGDTEVDSHLGLPLIAHPRERLDRVELPPFRAGIAAGAGAVMTSHVALPGLDPGAARPATVSPPIVTGLLRGDLGFDGLVYTDSMRMRGITDQQSTAQAAVAAVAAGHDVVVHAPDDAAAFAGLRRAVEAEVLTEARIDASVRRILSAKAGLGLHRNRAVSLDDLPRVVGARRHREAAAEVSRRGLTLVRDERGDVPLTLPPSAAVLYLSVLDRPSGWGAGAPSRTFLPALRDRWPDVTAVEVSERTAPAALDLVRAGADRYDAVVASVFVRSRRMDPAPGVVRLLRGLAEDGARRGQPFVAVLFGNPYVATVLPDLPALLLTYDFHDIAEDAAVRAIAGEAAVGGRLPVTLGDGFPAGHGLRRAARPR